MGHLFLFAFSESAESLQALRGDDQIGHQLAKVGVRPDDKMRIRWDRPTKTPQIPTPQSIYAGDKEVGQFIGFHYDGDPTGTEHAPAPIIPPHYTVATVDGSQTDQLYPIQGKILAEIIDSFKTDSENYKFRALDQLIKEAEGDEEKEDAIFEKYKHAGTMHFVFRNDTENPAGLYLLKGTTFHPGDEKLMESVAGCPHHFKGDYQSPRLASQVRVPQGYTAPKPRF